VTAGSRRRRQLKDFLRAKRGALTPAGAGLPDAGRRRTPGLRREEVAVLAGVGVQRPDGLSGEEERHGPAADAAPQNARPNQ